MSGGVRFGIENTVDFTANTVGMLTDEQRGEFLVDVDFRGEPGAMWNARFPFVATLTRGGVRMAMKGSREHRVSAAQAASFHQLAAELEYAVHRWTSARERSGQPK
jgi:hypothetical protein